MSKARCENHRCDWKGDDSEMLRAPHPFDLADEVVGCPNCKDIGTLAEVCDEPGCWEVSTMGTPTGEGYRRTCFNHRPSR